MADMFEEVAKTLCSPKQRRGEIDQQPADMVRFYLKADKPMLAENVSGRHWTKPLARQGTAAGVQDQWDSATGRPVLRSRGFDNLTQDRSIPMTDEAMSPLRRCIIEDMTIRHVRGGL